MKITQCELIEEFKDITECVDILPFADCDGLPISDIFAPLLIEDDLSSTKKTRRPDEPGENKPLQNMRDLFYVGERPAKRIFVKGEAGCGKSLFCIRLLDIWWRLKEAGKISVNDSLQQCLSSFDLVFYVPLRHVEGGETSVVELWKPDTAIVALSRYRVIDLCTTR